MIKNFLLLLTSIFLLNGCISITKEVPSYDTYRLSLKNSNNQTNVPLNKSIYIYEPKSLSSINTKAINYSKEHFEQEKYALSKWSDKPTKMLQELMANYFVSKNSFNYVTTSNIKTNTDFRLVSQLVDFRHTFTKTNSYADFSIRVFLIDNKTEEVFFKSFTYNKVAKKSDARGVVIAFDELINIFLTDLNNFLEKSIIKSK